MSDTRREIAERLLRDNQYFDSNAVMIVSVDKIESAMAEYAAAVLEEMAEKLDSLADDFGVADREQLAPRAYRLGARFVRARAAQERER